MKKLIFLFALVIASSAFASTYRDGVYRGYYISGQETQIEVQFNLENDVVKDAKYRTLYYKGHDWLKEESFVAQNGGYLAALNYLVGKTLDAKTLDKLYVPEEIEKAGATVRGGKLRYAVQSGLLAGPLRLPAKK